MDPCRTVYEALEAHGYDPRGPVHKFRARCPAHDGDDHNLIVKEKMDGTAGVHCYVYDCKLTDILDKIGLSYRDLLRPGQDHSRDVKLEPPPPPTRRAKKLMDVLSLLDEIKQPWLVMVGTDCPFCGSGGAWLRTRVPRAAEPAHVWVDLDGTEHHVAASPEVKGGGLYIDCPNGCSDKAFMQGLRGKVAMVREKPFKAKPDIKAA